LDRRQSLLELALRGGVDEHGALVARDREPLVAQAVRQVVGVGVDEAEETEEAVRALGAELDPQPPVVLRHARTLVVRGVRLRLCPDEVDQGAESEDPQSIAGFVSGSLTTMSLPCLEYFRGVA